MLWFLQMWETQLHNLWCLRDYDHLLWQVNGRIALPDQTKALFSPASYFHSGQPVSCVKAPAGQEGISVSPELVLNSSWACVCYVPTRDIWLTVTLTEFSRFLRDSFSSATPSSEFPWPTGIWTEISWVLVCHSIHYTTLVPIPKSIPVLEIIHLYLSWFGVSLSWITYHHRCCSFLCLFPTRLCSK